MGTPGSLPVPQAPTQTLPPVPTDPAIPPATGTTPGDLVPGGLPPTLVPQVPVVPSQSGGLVPSLTPLPPLPSSPRTGGGLVEVPGDQPLPVCLPPLATLGNC
jgi:hypothetical protein